MARLVRIGQAAHDEEDRALRFLERSLPDDVWIYSNVLLPSGIPGESFEYDAIVIALHAVFAVELKAWGGRIEGNRDHWILPSGKAVPSPIPLIEKKAKILKSLALSAGADFRDLRVQGLVFVTLEDAAPQITDDFASYVRTLRTIGPALTDVSLFGRAGTLTPQKAGRLGKRICDGGKPALVDRKLGDFDLLDRLPSPSGSYEAWRAELRVTRQNRILHVYPIPHGDRKAADQQRIRARKEAALHERLTNYPEIVRCHGIFTAEEPERIVVVFEDTTSLLSVAGWVRQFSRSGLLPRLSIARRIARALTAVHHEGIVHRRLSPDTILVRAVEEPDEVRLSAFDLGKDLVNRTETVTVSALQDPTLRCIAPEVFKLGETTTRSDLFSLGAVLYELFTGRRLFKRAEDVVAPYVAGPLALDGKELPSGLKTLVSELLSPDPADRPDGAVGVLTRLDEIAVQLSGGPPPLQPFARGQVLRDLYELEEPLGSGASGATWRARQLKLGIRVAVKIAQGDQVLAHDNEQEALLDLQKKKVDCPNLLRFVTSETLPDGRPFLVNRFVDGASGRELVVAGDPLTPEQFRTFAEGLYVALGALHGAGWLHRDVKPENIVVPLDTFSPVLLDLGLATPIGKGTDVISGSPAYKDPQLWVDGSWKPEHDLFATAVVLWEVLTRVHPFGGQPAERGREPEVRADDVPRTFPDSVRASLAVVFQHLLFERHRSRRPENASAALQALLEALDRKPGKGKQKASPQAAAPLVPPEARPETRLTEVPGISLRAAVALHRLGCQSFADLGRLDPESIPRRPGIGKAVIDEIRDLLEAVRERWPEFPPPDSGSGAPAETPWEELFPSLTGSPAPLSELGKTITAGLRSHLDDLGVTTIGQLASLPAAILAELPGIGRKKIEALRRALARHTDPSVPGTLASLHDALSKELKGSRFAAISALVGLSDGEFRKLEAVGEALGVTRQRVDQLGHDAVEALRQPSSAAGVLISATREFLGPRAFLPLEALARLLVLRFPLDPEAGVSPLGYARLAALLLEPGRRPTSLGGVRAAAAAPWKLGDPEELARTLEAEVSWPPRRPADLEGFLRGLLTQPVLLRLEASGVDLADVVDGLLDLAPSLVRGADGLVYRSPVSAAKAFDYLRVRAGLPLDVDEQTFRVEVARRLPGVQLPETTVELSPLLARIGLELRGGKVINPLLAVEAAIIETPALDRDVERQVVRFVRAGAPPLVESLAASVHRGGFRVVALPPGQHHLLSRRLASWLGEKLGEGSVRYVDVDRLLIGTLKAKGLWDDALFFDAKPAATWGWAEEELKAALDLELRRESKGKVTVLGRPALLGSLGLLPWVSGFYDASRGGRHGLVVLAVPGGVKDGRVWLNGRHSIPCVPDMAPVYLEALEDEVAA